MLFWILLSKEIAIRSKESVDSYLWNIYLLGLPNWFKWNKSRKNKVDFNKIELIISNSTQEFDKERKEFNLYLNFNEIFNMIINMKKKTYVQLALLFLLFNYFIVINAVAVDYSLDIDKDSNWIWRVDEYDEDIYKNIFIEDADFDEDDQQQIKVTAIDNRNEKWVISYDRWDYTDNTDDFSEPPDDEKFKTVYKDPEDQADDVLDLGDIANMWIVPSPYISYIEEFRDEFDNPIIDVSVEDDKLIAKYVQIGRAVLYEIEIEYGDDGLAEEIEYIDENGDTFVKITLLRETIPGYNLFLIILSICGVISLIIWRKKYYFQNK